eukprot:g5857.t1
MSLSSSSGLPLSLPAWLEGSAAQITKSDEWTTLTKELHKVVKHQLDLNNIHAFVDLSPAERALFIDKAEEDLKGSGIYKGFLAKLSDKVDECLTTEVLATMRLAGNSMTKTELLVQRAEEGLLSLVKSFPNEHDSLKLLLNQSIPNKVRVQVWKSQLSNPSARRVFEEQVSVSLLKTMSKQDAEITRNCQRLADKHFPDIADDLQLMTMMKTVVSYADKVFSSDPPWLYFSVVPLLRVFGHLRAPVHYRESSMLEQGESEADSIKDVSGKVRGGIGTLNAQTAKQVLENGDIGTLVEVFFGVLSLDRPILASEGEIEVFRGGEGNPKYLLLEPLLLKHSHQLHSHIVQVFSQDGNLSTHPVSDLFLRPVQQLMVGFFKPEVVLFVWDQCMLTSFVEMLPKISVATLLILKESILQADTPQLMSRVLKQQARSSVTLRRLQHEMSRKFMKEIREHLGVSDPTASLWSSVSGGSAEQSLYALQPNKEFENLRGLLGDEKFEEEMSKMDLEAARREMKKEREEKESFLKRKQDDRDKKLKEIQVRNDKKRLHLKMKMAEQVTARNLALSKAAERKRKAQWGATQVQRLFRHWVVRRKIKWMLEQMKAHDSALIIQCAFRTAIAREKADVIRTKRTKDLIMKDIVEAAAATSLQSGFRRVLGIRRAILRKYQLEEKDVISVQLKSGPFGLEFKVGDRLDATGCRVKKKIENKNLINYSSRIKEGMWLILVDADDIPSLKFKTVRMLLRLKEHKRKKILLSAKRPEIKRSPEEQNARDQRRKKLEEDLKQFKEIEDKVMDKESNEKIDGRKETLEFSQEKEKGEEDEDGREKKKNLELSKGKEENIKIDSSKEKESLEVEKVKEESEEYSDDDVNNDNNDDNNDDKSNNADNEEKDTIKEESKYILAEPRETWSPPQIDGNEDKRVIVPPGPSGVLLKPSPNAGDAPVVIGFSPINDGESGSVEKDGSITPGQVLSMVVKFSSEKPSEEEQNGKGEETINTYEFDYADVMGKIKEWQDCYKAFYFRDGNEYLKTLKEIVQPQVTIAEDANILESAFLKSMLALRWLAVGDSNASLQVDQVIKEGEEILEKERDMARKKAKCPTDKAKFEAEDKKWNEKGGKKLKAWQKKKDKALALAEKAEAARLKKLGANAKKKSAIAKKNEIANAKKMEKLQKRTSKR